MYLIDWTLVTIVGPKIRVDNFMFGGVNQKTVDDEIARKKKEYDDNLELVEVSKLYEKNKVSKYS